MLNARRAGSLNVVVLYGGDSPEREISLGSGIAVAAALEAGGHRVRTIDPAETDLESCDWQNIDVCFIALQGNVGKDGRVQLQLDELGVPYTGCRPAAARLASSKSSSKERFLAAGIPTLPYVNLHIGRSNAGAAPLLGNLGFPVVIKPERGGSSLGVVVAESRDDVATAMQQCGEFGAFALAEPLISGTEYMVAVVDRHPLPPLEVMHGRRLFDFDAKFHSSSTECRLPADEYDPKMCHIKQIAKNAAAALHTNGLVCVDLLRDRGGNCWVLGVDVVPTFTERSLARLAATAAGWELHQLCERLIQSALNMEAIA